MISTPRDNNRHPTIMGTLDSDGVTPISILVDAVKHSMMVANSNTGSSLPFDNAERDDNRVPVMWATSSADGVTPIPIYATSTGELKINHL